MFRTLAIGAVALGFAAASAATAQPMPPADSAPPAAPAIPADAAPAGTLPPTAPTVVDNTLPPPPPASLNKTYPVCTRGMTDNCQNPGEGGAPGRGRSTHVKRHRS